MSMVAQGRSPSSHPDMMTERPPFSDWVVESQSLVLYSRSNTGINGYRDSHKNMVDRAIVMVIKII